MELAGTGLNEILAEFESHWLGREVEGAQYLPAEAAFFRDIVSGVVREQRVLDPLIDEALAKSWPLKRIEAVLRAALRAGAYELDHRRDVPARVVVSEYADVAAAFVERDETGMVNAVLDQLARKLRADEFAAKPLSAGGMKANSAMNSDDDKLSAEDRLIARFFTPLATHPGALGLSDDAAFIKPPPGCDIVLKTDAIIGGVHFFAEDAARDVAKKALRVNLSDLAAKGAKPLGFLLSLALPKEIGDDWLAAFAQGLRDDADAYRLSAVRRRHRPHAGADHDLHRHGRQRAGRHYGAPRRRQARRPRVRHRHDRRRRARPGHCARARHWQLSDAQREHLLSRYLLPQPRNALTEAVRTHASAAMDVSDGLVGDFTKLCRRVAGGGRDRGRARAAVGRRASGVAAEPAMLETALTGGDDFEIVCTVPAAKADSFRAAAKTANVAGDRDRRRSKRARASASSTATARR